MTNEEIGQPIEFIIEQCLQILHEIAHPRY